MQNDNYDLNVNDFKQYITGIFKFAGTAFRFLISVLLENKLLILAVLLISGGLSYFYLKQNNKVEELRMSCIYSDNQAKVFGEMLQQVDFLLDNQSFDKAAELLKMDRKSIKMLKSVKGKTMSLGKLEEVYSGNKDPFYIYVELSDPGIATVLEEKLINYLNSNILSQKSVKRQKSKWSSRINFYEHQLLKLDSLKDVIRQSYLSDNDNIDLAQKENSVVDIYKLSDSMSFFLNDVRYYYDNYVTVEKVYGFMPVKVTTSKSIIKRAIAISILSVVFVWLLLAVRRTIRSSE